MRAGRTGFDVDGAAGFRLFLSSCAGSRASGWSAEAAEKDAMTFDERLAAIRASMIEHKLEALVAIHDGAHFIETPNPVFVLSGFKSLGPAAVVLARDGEASLIVTPAWDVERAAAAAPGCGSSPPMMWSMRWIRLQQSPLARRQAGYRRPRGDALGHRWTRDRGWCRRPAPPTTSCSMPPPPRPSRRSPMRARPPASPNWATRASSKSRVPA